MFYERMREMEFKFAVMGAGIIANKFCDAVSLIPGADVIAVASKSQTRADKFAGRNHIRKAYDSYEKMLQSEKIDGVYIATTPNFHAALAQLCIRYHVPVICEKAMFMNSAEAEETLALAGQEQVFVMEAMWSRFLPAIREARDWLEQGKIGPPHRLQISVGTAFDPVINRRVLDPDIGGGAAFDLTVYTYEIATFFFGLDYHKHLVSTTWNDDGIDVNDEVVLNYGSKIAVLSSTCDSVIDQKLEISGMGGRIVVPDAHYSSEAFLYDKDNNEIGHFLDTKTKNGFVYEIEDMIKGVSEGRLESDVIPHETTLACAGIFDDLMADKPIE